MIKEEIIQKRGGSFIFSTMQIVRLTERLKYFLLRGCGMVLSIKDKIH